ALEQQVVLERIQVGDAEAVADERSRRGTSSRSDGDALRAGPRDEVLYDQVVAGVTGPADHTELVLEAFDDLVREFLPEPAVRAGVGEIAKQLDLDDSLLPVLVAQRGILQEGIVARGVEHTGFLGALEQRSPFRFGQWKRRYVISLPELDVHLLRDRKRIGENIVTIAEESRHLVTVLKIEPLVVMQAGWI